jgi:hypothetical protein
MVNMRTGQKNSNMNDRIFFIKFRISVPTKMTAGYVKQVGDVSIPVDL